MKKFLPPFLLLLFCLYGFTRAIAAEDIQVVVENPAATISWQIVDEGRLLVSVLDKAEEPIRGLTAEDFRVGRGIQKAEILSAAPLETTEQVPLNIVFVVDNSFSMKERRAVEPLLSAMDEFLKSVRPIDNIHLVVFDDRPAMKVEQHTVHAKTFKSSDIVDLRGFLKDSLEQGSTGKTYLYEAMATGIDIVRRMPVEDQKFMVIFSDGEDINSSLPTAFIEEQGRDIENFEAFCVDYMPVAKLDRFLASFARTHHGRIWKATSADQLLSIFQAFTTTLRYRYVVSYRFLEPITAEPSELNFQMLTRVDGTPLPNCLFFEFGQSEIPADYALIKDPADVISFDAGSLTKAMDRYRNMLNLAGQNLARDAALRIKIVGCYSGRSIETGDSDLAGRRAAAVASYLREIWNIDAARMDIVTQDLTAAATSEDGAGAGVEDQRVELVFDPAENGAAAGDGFMVEAGGRRDLTVTTNLFAETGMASWRLTVFGDDQPLKTLSGQGEIDAIHIIPLEELDVAGLKAFGTLGVQAEVTDTGGGVSQTQKLTLPLTVSMQKWDDAMIRPPRGSMTLEPATVTIEELTTIDSSPFLNYVYYETASSEIPARYIVYHNQADAQNFGESRLEGTLEKYYNILNVLGSRLRDHADARIRIVGCNSHRDAEYGKTDLSRGRAEAVRAYLKYIWGIDSARMEVEARNLPAVASTNSRSEGRAENQRVEIYSDSPALLDVIKSTYVQEISDAEQFLIRPQVYSGYGIDHWTIQLTGDGAPIGSLAGEGDMQPAYHLALADLNLRKLSAFQRITAEVSATDRKGRTASTRADADIRFIKRRELLSRKEGYRVLEKYALVLFDFDSDGISAQNKNIVDRIAARIKELPDTKVSIVGHTDTIGQEAYNLDLSTRRAKAAYDHILAEGVPATDHITYQGIGPQDALFDNGLPEGRALNRTVTVTLEYAQKE